MNSYNRQRGKHIRTFFIVLTLLIMVVSLTTATSPRRITLNPVIDHEHKILENNISTENTTSSSNETNQIPLKGEIILLNETNGYYVLLGDSETKTNLKVNFSKITQLPVIINEPVVMKQELTISNEDNETLIETINLWDYETQIPEENLKDLIKIEILDENNNLESEKPILETKLSPNETKKYLINYVYAPITKYVTCKKQTLADIIPKGAIITETELPLDTIITNNCNVKVSYDGLLEFENITIRLPEIPTEKILSITDKTTNKELQINEGVIRIKY